VTPPVVESSPQVTEPPRPVPLPVPVPLLPSPRPELVVQHVPPVSHPTPPLSAPTPSVVVPVVQAISPVVSGHVLKATPPATRASSRLGRGVYKHLHFDNSPVPSQHQRKVAMIAARARAREHFSQATWYSATPCGMSRIC
jgi:hypothetical protein